MGGNWPKWLPTLVLLGLVFLFMVFAGVQYQGQEVVQPVPYSRVKALITQGEVTSVTLRGNRLTGTLKSPVPLVEGQKPVESFASEVPAFGDPALLPALEKHDVQPDRAPERAGRLVVPASCSGACCWRSTCGSGTACTATSPGGLGGMGGGGGLQDFLGGRTRR